MDHGRRCRLPNKINSRPCFHHTSVGSAQHRFFQTGRIFKRVKEGYLSRAPTSFFTIALAAGGCASGDLPRRANKSQLLQPLVTAPPVTTALLWCEGGRRAIEQRAWCFAAAEEEPKQRRSTMEQYSKSVCALLSLGLDRLTSEIQRWGDKEMAEGAEGKGPMSKEQMLRGRMASQPGKRKKRMENTPKQEKKACRRRKKI